MNSLWKHSAFCLLFGAGSLQAALSSCKPTNSFEQGHELRQNQMTAAYNAPGRIDVRGSWDLLLTGSYIFWQASEDGLNLGISNASPLVALPINGHIVSTDFKFKSGYQAGLGIFTELDDWDGRAEYTWLHTRNTVRSNGPEGGGLIPAWGHPANVANDVFSGSGRWKLSLSVIDVNVGRSCYIGTRLTFRPFFGIRPTWINQKYVATYATTLTETYQVRSTSNSCGIGPEVGVEMNWLLGYGIRLIGNAEADILFTRYNLRYKEENSLTPSTLAVNLSQRDIYCLRPHSDCSLGLGWGTYFNNYNYHFDLSALYDFQVFLDQNMFVNFVDNVSVGKSTAPNGNLYTQGVTGNLRLDF